MFNIGDRVKDEKYGEGTVVCTNADKYLPVLVKFDNPNDRLHYGNCSDVNNHQHWYFTEGGGYNNESRIKLIET